MHGLGGKGDSNRLVAFMSFLLLIRILKQKGRHEEEMVAGSWTQDEMRAQTTLGSQRSQPHSPHQPHTLLLLTQGWKCLQHFSTVTFLPQNQKLPLSHWRTVTGGDNSAVMSKSSLICLLTVERRDNLQANVCINMCPIFLTSVFSFKTGFLVFF